MNPTFLIFQGRKDNIYSIFFFYKALQNKHLVKTAKLKHFKWNYSISHSGKVRHKAVLKN